MPVGTPDNPETCAMHHRPYGATPLRRQVSFDRSSAVMREFLLHAVAKVFGVDSILILLPTRGNATIARARQVAMYLAHVACGLSLTQVGVLFERDRTTVAHACRVTEERREDQDFDRAIELLEQAVRLFALAEA